MYSAMALSFNLSYPHPHKLCTSMPTIVAALSFSPSLISTKYIAPSYRGSSQVFRPVRCIHELLQEEKPLQQLSPSLESPHVDDLRALRAIPEIWRCTANKYGDRVALVDPHHNPPMNVTFKQLEQEILQFSEGLRQAGIFPHEKVALFADNSCRWLIADQGIMAIGAVDVVRGSRSSFEELSVIYSHSDSVALIVENKELWNKLLPSLITSSSLRFVVLLWGDKFSLAKDVPFSMYTYEELLALGHRAKTLATATDGVRSFHHHQIQADDMATIVYTSGTTGNPKGVMLTHSNLLHQVVYLWEVVQPNPGDRFLSILPPWHMYERSVEYFSLSRGSEQVYTNIKCLKDDLKRYPPHYMVSVPLIFDSLYSGVQRELSRSSNVRRFIASALIGISMIFMNMKRVYQGRDMSKVKIDNTTLFGSALEWLVARITAALLFPFHTLANTIVYQKIHLAIGIKKAAITGGGSLSPHVDKFFEAIGITLLNGYGLTESSPVVAARNANNNVLGSVGRMLSETEVKIVDIHSGETLPPGKKGLVKLRGTPVMKGYYKNEDASRQAIDEKGWLDTGDLGWLCPELKVGAARCCGGNLVLDGRAKDVIVLSTGENIEPTVIEEAAIRSRYVQQIMVVGQDQRRLGALIVVNKDELISAGFLDAEEICTYPSPQKLIMLIHEELQHYTSDCPAKIGPFILLEDAFTVENAMLTPTMKVRRNMVASKYESLIKDLFKS